MRKLVSISALILLVGCQNPMNDILETSKLNKVEMQYVQSYISNLILKEFKDI